MIDRSQFTPSGENPPYPVPVNEHCTVPTERMANLLASLVIPPGAENPVILEIGTGSGYQAAVLAERAAYVTTCEADRELAYAAASKLPANVTLALAPFRGEGLEGVYDGVLVTFACRAIDPAWERALREGGRLVVPEKIGSLCRIAVYEKRGESLEMLDVAAYAPFTEALPEVC